MKGSSKVIVGATLIMVVSLAIVLGLVLVLLAELYCSLLLRRRQLRRTTSNAATSRPFTSICEAAEGCQLHHEHSETPSLSSFYAQGVLHAPRSFLFPSVHVSDGLDLEKQQHSQRSQFSESQTQLPSSSSHQIGHAFSIPPSPTFVPLASPRLVVEVPLHFSPRDEDYGGSYAENYIYICNPIYDDNGNGPSRVDDTPFQTPDSSPSRLETLGSSGEDNVISPSSTPLTPSLTPMKKLPAEGCSVSLRDARSLATSGSDSNSNNYGISSSSSSSSGSPCTSPSW